MKLNDLFSNAYDNYGNFSHANGAVKSKDVVMNEIMNFSLQMMPKVINNLPIFKDFENKNLLNIIHNALKDIKCMDKYYCAFILLFNVCVIHQYEHEKICSLSKAYKRALHFSKNEDVKVINNIYDLRDGLPKFTYNIDCALKNLSQEGIYETIDVFYLAFSRTNKLNQFSFLFENLFWFSEQINNHCDLHKVMGDEQALYCMQTYVLWYDKIIENIKLNLIIDNFDVFNNNKLHNIDNLKAINALYNDKADERLGKWISSNQE